MGKGLRLRGKGYGVWIVALCGLTMPLRAGYAGCGPAGHCGAPRTAALSAPVAFQSRALQAAVRDGYLAVSGEGL